MNTIIYIENYKMGGSNSITKQLEDINRGQANTTAIMQAVMDAAYGDKSFATAYVDNGDGTRSEITIPSNHYLFSEISRIAKNQESMLSLGAGPAGILDGMGNFREVFVAGYKPNKAGGCFFNGISVANGTALRDLMTPAPCARIKSAGAGISHFSCRILKFSKRADLLGMPEGVSLPEARARIASGTLAVEEFEGLYPARPARSRFYGRFAVLAINGYTLEGDAIAALDTLKYSDEENVAGSRELFQGDMVVTGDGAALYEVMSARPATNVAVLRRRGGWGALKPGANALEFYYSEGAGESECLLPITAGDACLVYASPVDKSGAAAPYGAGIRIDAETLTVLHNGTETPLNTYIAAYVKNAGEYLKMLLEEDAIPRSMGVVPPAPYVQAGFFKVQQINKHLSNSDIERINKLAADKDGAFRQIAALSASIGEVGARLSAGRYKTQKDKTDDAARQAALISEKGQKTALYESIVRDIAARTSEGYGDMGAKFRVRGFWPVAGPLISPHTRPQHIIKYLVEYRYISPQSEGADAAQIRYTLEDGTPVTGAFSPWQRFETPMLRKTALAGGGFGWPDTVAENADEVNINQLDIPIRTGESVEIRIKAMGEAGWPYTLIEGPWCAPVRIDFPASLAGASIISPSAASNAEDMRKVELDAMFRDRGITEHISASFTEREKYYAHRASAIASGFLSPEQATISVFDKLLEFSNSIKALNEQISRRQLLPSIEITDGANAYPVQDKSDLSLFAGYYSEIVDMSDPLQWGAIAEKVYYLKISNKNASQIELQSPKYGARGDQSPDPGIAVMLPKGTEFQHYGQIAYLRALDMTDDPAAPLYRMGAAPMPHVPPATDISAGLAPNALIYGGGALSEAHIVRGYLGKDFVAYSLQHPYAGNAGGRALMASQEFLRASCFTHEGRGDAQQAFVLDNGTPSYAFANGARVAAQHAGFAEYDRYLIGQASCTARFFMKMPDISIMQTNGNSPSAYRVIEPGDGNAVIIPLVFQFRMADAVGCIDGDGSKTPASNFDYTKRLSIELLSGGASFKFDVRATCRFRASALSNADLPVERLNNIYSAALPADTEISAL